MVLIVGVGIGDAGEEVLELLARQQVAVDQRFLAELGQVRIARFVGHDVEPPVEDLLAVGLFGIGFGSRGDVGDIGFDQLNSISAQAFQYGIHHQGRGHVQALIVIASGNADPQAFQIGRRQPVIFPGNHPIE